MKKMMAMLLASVMVAGTFATTAFAYTGDDVQKNTSVNTAAQEADAAESANAGKTDNTDRWQISRRNIRYCLPRRAKSSVPVMSPIHTIRSAQPLSCNVCSHTC